jgi:hypothetical protein
MAEILQLAAVAGDQRIWDLAAHLAELLDNAGSEPTGKNSLKFG